MTDVLKKKIGLVRLSTNVIAAVVLMALVSGAPPAQAEPDPTTVLWIPMNADDSDGALDIDGLLAFSTGSVELSADEFAAITAALQSSDSVAETRKTVSGYRKNVRLLVLSDDDIQIVSDGCRLVDLRARVSIELPQRLVDAINSTPPVSKSWACRS